MVSRSLTAIRDTRSPATVEDRLDPALSSAIPYLIHRRKHRSRARVGHDVPGSTILVAVAVLMTDTSVLGSLHHEYSLVKEAA